MTSLSSARNSKLDRYTGVNQGAIQEVSRCVWLERTAHAAQTMNCYIKQIILTPCLKFLRVTIEWWRHHGIPQTSKDQLITMLLLLISNYLHFLCQYFMTFLSIVRIFCCACDVIINHTFFFLKRKHLFLILSLTVCFDWFWYGSLIKPCPQLDRSN